MPLTTLPGSGEHREFHIAVIPRTESARSVTSADPAPPETPATAGKICEPRVFLQGDGDRITNIRVQCSCGQIMDLACVYDPSSKPA